MADEKKTESSASAKKAKPAAKAEAKPAAKAEAKPAKAAKPASEKTARSKATPSVSDGPACRAEKCRQPVRAKGYCRKHYIAWRRGEVGDHHRYKTCSKEGCRKPRAKGGLCDEHAGTAAPAGAAPAAEGGAPPA
jgi:hypothetical protein